MYLKKVFSVVLLFVLTIHSIGFSYYANNFYSDDDMNNSYYTSYNTNSSYHKLDLFRTTPQSDFLNSSINESFIMTLQKNGTESEFYNTKLAKNLDISDYTGFEIGKGNEYSSYSHLTNGYDKQVFSDVKHKDDKLYSCTVTTDRGGFVKEAISDIKYTAQDLVTSLAVKTFGQNGGTAILQTISGITAGSSLDQNRYRDELDYNTIKMNEPGTRGFGINVAALEGRLAPPNNLAKEFTIKALGNIINYKDVSWAKDLITGFKANMTDNKGNISNWNVSSILDQKGKIGAMAVDVISKNIILHKDWDKNGDISLDKFVKNIKLGVNPLNILGSSTIQIGDIKIAYLANSYDDTQKIQATYNSEFKTVINKIGAAIKKVGEYIGKTISWIKGLFGIGSSEEPLNTSTPQPTLMSKDSPLTDPQIKNLDIQDKSQTLLTTSHSDSFQDSNYDTTNISKIKDTKELFNEQQKQETNLKTNNSVESKSIMPTDQDFIKQALNLTFIKNSAFLIRNVTIGKDKINTRKKAPIGAMIITSDVETTSDNTKIGKIITSIKFGVNFLPPKHQTLIGNKHHGAGLDVESKVIVNIPKKQVAGYYQIAARYKGIYNGVKFKEKGFMRIQGNINAVAGANIFKPIGVDLKAGVHSQIKDGIGNNNNIYSYLETTKEGLASVYKHRQIDPKGQMTIFEIKFIPKMMNEKEKTKSGVTNNNIKLLYDVLNGSKTSWKPKEAKQVTNFIINKYKDQKIHIDQKFKHGLEAYITLLPSVRQTYIKDFEKLKQNINNSKSIMERINPMNILPNSTFYSVSRHNTKKSNNHYAYVMKQEDDKWYSRS